MPSLQSLSARAAVGSGASAEDAEGAGYPAAAVSALAAAEALERRRAAERAAEGGLTCDGVHRLMVERLGLTMSQAEEANPCFKRAVLKGHIVLSAQSSLQASHVAAAGSAAG